MIIVVVINNYALAARSQINTKWSSGYNLVDMYENPLKETRLTRAEVYHNIAFSKVVNISKSLPKNKNIAIVSDMVIENYYLRDLSIIKKRVYLISMRPLGYSFKNIKKGIIEQKGSKPKPIEKIEDIKYLADKYDYVFTMWPFRKSYKYELSKIMEKPITEVSVKKISGTGIDNSFIETYLLEKK